jgi:hypothetical protein
MRRTSIIILAAALVGASAAAADAQGRQNGRGRVDVAREQGVAPGQLPSANQCRVWYDNRPAGRQPSATSCRQAESVAARERNARVIYGENVFRTRDTRYGEQQNDRAVRRGTVRDPRVNGGYGDYRRESRDTNAPAFQNGYRDGMTKGREDAEDRDRFDVNRHSWYRSANRGYESRDGRRSDYQRIYKQGFEAGYAEGYRVYARR